MDPHSPQKDISLPGSSFFEIYTDRTSSRPPAAKSPKATATSSNGGSQPPLPSGPCNFSHSAGNQCGCRRFYSQAGPSPSDPASDGVLMCMCAHHACFHDDLGGATVTTVAASPGVGLPWSSSASRNVAGRAPPAPVAEAPKPTSQRDPLSPVLDLSGRDGSGGAELPAPPHTAPLPLSLNAAISVVAAGHDDSELPDTLSWRNFVVQSQEYHAAAPPPAFPPQPPQPRRVSGGNGRTPSGRRTGGSAALPPIPRECLMLASGDSASPSSSSGAVTTTTTSPPPPPPPRTPTALLPSNAGLGGRPGSGGAVSTAGSSVGGLAAAGGGQGFPAHVNHPSQPSSTTSSARRSYMRPFAGRGLQTLSGGGVRPSAGAGAGAGRAGQIAGLPRKGSGGGHTNPATAIGPTIMPGSALPPPPPPPPPAAAADWRLQAAAALPPGADSPPPPQPYSAGDGVGSGSTLVGTGPTTTTQERRGRRARSDTPKPRHRASKEGGIMPGGGGVVPALGSDPAHYSGGGDGALMLRRDSSSGGGPGSGIVVSLDALLPESLQQLSATVDSHERRIDRLENPSFLASSGGLLLDNPHRGGVVAPGSMTGAVEEAAAACYDRHEHADVRMAELEARVDDVERAVQAADDSSVGGSRVGSRRMIGGGQNSILVGPAPAGSVVSTTASHVTTDNGNNPALRLSDLEAQLAGMQAQLNRLQASAPPTPTPAAPWKLEVVFLPFPLRGLWLRADEFVAAAAAESGSGASSGAGRHQTPALDDWFTTQQLATQFGPYSSAKTPLLPSAGASAWPPRTADGYNNVNDALQQHWLFPRACPPGKVLDRRLRSRGFVRTVAVRGSDHRAVREALAGAFGELLRKFRDAQRQDEVVANVGAPLPFPSAGSRARSGGKRLPGTSLHVHAASDGRLRLSTTAITQPPAALELQARFLGLSEPLVPLRKIRRDARLRFLEPAEMVSPALWDAAFLSGGVVMKAAGGVNRLYVTTPEAYLQGLGTQHQTGHHPHSKAAWSWQRVRELSRVYPDEGDLTSPSAARPTSPGSGKRKRDGRDVDGSEPLPLPLPPASLSSSRVGVPEADALEECWNWVERLDAAPPSPGPQPTTAVGDGASEEDDASQLSQLSQPLSLRQARHADHHQHHHHQRHVARISPAAPPQAHQRVSQLHHHPQTGSAFIRSSSSPSSDLFYTGLESLPPAHHVNTNPNLPYGLLQNSSSLSGGSMRHAAPLSPLIERRRQQQQQQQQQHDPGQAQAQRQPTSSPVVGGNRARPVPPPHLRTTSMPPSLPPLMTAPSSATGGRMQGGVVVPSPLSPAQMMTGNNANNNNNHPALRAGSPLLKRRVASFEAASPSKLRGTPLHGHSLVEDDEDELTLERTRQARRRSDTAGGLYVTAAMADAKRRRTRSPSLGAAVAQAQMMQAQAAGRNKGHNNNNNNNNYMPYNQRTPRWSDMSMSPSPGPDGGFYAGSGVAGAGFPGAAGNVALQHQHQNRQQQPPTRGTTPAWYATPYSNYARGTTPYSNHGNNGARGVTPYSGTNYAAGLGRATTPGLGGGPMLLDEDVDSDADTDAFDEGESRRQVDDDNDDDSDKGSTTDAYDSASAPVDEPAEELEDEDEDESLGSADSSETSESADEALDDSFIDDAPQPMYRPQQQQQQQQHQLAAAALRSASDSFSQQLRRQLEQPRMHYHNQSRPRLSDAYDDDGEDDGAAAPPPPPPPPEWMMARFNTARDRGAAAPSRQGQGGRDVLPPEDEPWPGIEDNDDEQRSAEQEEGPDDEENSDPSQARQHTADSAMFLDDDDDEEGDNASPAGSSVPSEYPSTQRALQQQQQQRQQMRQQQQQQRSRQRRHAHADDDAGFTIHEDRESCDSDESETGSKETDASEGDGRDAFVTSTEARRAVGGGGSSSSMGNYGARF